MAHSDAPPAPTVATGDVLGREIDVEAVLLRFPSTQTVKGIFLGRFRAALERQWAELEPRLLAPPKAGTYLAFRDYPLRDHTLLLFAIARLRHPRLPLEEAVRRVGKHDVKVVLESLLGRVVSAAVDSPKEALLAVPALYRHIVTGPRYEVAEQGPRRVVLTLRDAYGAWGYQLGQLEGVVEHFRGKPTIGLSVDPSGERRFEVEW